MPDADAIPVIDLGPYLADQPGALDHAAAELRHALTEIGFYSIVNHGVPSALVHEVYRQVARFHARPLDEKLKIKLDKHNVPFGKLYVYDFYRKTSYALPDAQAARNYFNHISIDRGASCPPRDGENGVDVLNGLLSQLRGYSASPTLHRCQVRHPEISLSPLSAAVTIRQHLCLGAVTLTDRLRDRWVAARARTALSSGLAPANA
jgi:isopenicillin N synthase-like dioxygenase